MDNQRNKKGSGAKVDENVLYPGKVPPQSKELEMNVLGGMMIDNTLIDIVSTIITPKQFYVSSHSKICQVIFELRDRNEVADIVTITEELTRKGELQAVGGPLLLAELSTAYYSQESIEYSAKRIKENWEKREIILMTYAANEMAYDPTVASSELMNRLQSELYEIGNSMFRKGSTKTKDNIKEMMSEIESKEASEHSTLMGIPSGFDELDDITAGFEKANLIILAGRPSHGKTALALKFARNAAIDHKKNIGIFSIEMSTKELTLRQMATEAEIEMRKLKKGKGLTDAEYQKLTNTYQTFSSGGQIIIDDSNPINMTEIRAKARRWKIEHGVDMIMVDYLQIIFSEAKKGSFGDRYIEIGQITTGLKQLAKELDIPVIALSQLSRKVEDRADKRPQLSDLRESGNIEQDADVVIFINRPAVYMSKDNPQFDEIRYDAEVIVAKQRNGPIGLAKLKFIDRFANFINRNELNKYDVKYYNDDQPF